MYKFISSNFPAVHGCYIMKNDKNKIVYVGKSKNLRKRISNYFNLNNTAKRVLRKTIADIEIILTESELESLSLENNLIKLYKPRFNKALKHEMWTYYYLLLTGEKIPSIIKYRPKRLNKALNNRKVIDKNIIIGPYISSVLREEIYTFVTDHFKLRTCKPLKNRICIRYHIKTCSGICEKKVSETEYSNQVKEALKFLHGTKSEVEKYLKKMMYKYSEEQKFEKALKMKNALEMIKKALPRQIVERPKNYDQLIAVSDKKALLIVYIKQGIVFHLKEYNLIEDFNKEKTYKEIIKQLPSLLTDSCQTEILTDKKTTIKLVSTILKKRTQAVIRLINSEITEEKELLKFAQKNHKFRKKSILPQ